MKTTIAIPTILSRINHLLRRWYRDSATGVQPDTMLLSADVRDELRQIQISPYQFLIDDPSGISDTLYGMDIILVPHRTNYLALGQLVKET